MTPESTSQGSSTESSQRGRLPRPQRPILLLTVNQRETDALRAVFGAAQPAEDFAHGDHPYVRFAPVLDDAGTPQRDVIAFRCQMGSQRSGAAQERVSKAIAHFNPAAVLAVGVGFGLKDKQALGDVLIATQVTTYESARLNHDGSILQRAEMPPATPQWLERATQIDLPGIQRRNGLVLCGEKLVDNAEFRESLRTRFVLAIGGDMESFGVATACMGHDGERVGWLMIKGVSDLGDGNKNGASDLQADFDQFQAAYRAAIVAYSTVHLRAPQAPSLADAAQHWLQTQREREQQASVWLSVPSEAAASPAQAAPTAVAPAHPDLSPLPPALRPPDHTFRGRAKLLQALIERLKAGQSTTVVGDAGMGKTALAVEALQRLLGRDPAAQRTALAASAFPDGVLMLDLYRHHGRAELAWSALADDLGVPTQDAAGQALGAAQRAVRGCAGKRLLLVVEGGEEADGSRDPGAGPDAPDAAARTTADALLAPLALAGPVLWLTRRGDQRPAAQTLPLGEALGDADARALFDELTADPVTRAPRVAPAARDRALALLHGHPLGITWTAGLLAAGNVVAADLLDDLATQPSLSLHQPAQKEHTLGWLFGRSLRALDADARHSLLAAGLLAHAPFPRAAIAAATGLDDRAQRRALEACLAVRLLRSDPKADRAPYGFGHALAYRCAREQARADARVAAQLAGLAEWAHAALWDAIRPGAAAAADEQVTALLAHALAVVDADTPPGLWQPLVHGLLYGIGDRFGVSGRLALARRAREAAEAWLRQAQQRQPDEQRWWRAMAACQQRLGDQALREGRLAEAQRRFEAQWAICRRLGDEEPGNPDYQRNLSISYNNLGDVQWAQGDLAGAQMRYAAGLAIAERLVAQDAGNAHCQRDLVVSNIKLGDVQQAQGDLESAHTRYAAALEIVERLAAQDTGNAQWQRDLSVTYNKLGEVQQAQDDLAGAQVRYAAALAIRERLAAQDAGNAEWQRDVSVSYNKLGDVQQVQGDLAGAQVRYAAALAIRERLAAQDEGNAEWQRDLSVSYNNLGEVQQAQGDLAGAQMRYAAGLAIAERLAAQDAGNAQWQRHLSINYKNLGDVQQAQGDLAGAQMRYAAGLVIAERLATQDAGNAQWQRDLSISYDKLGAVQQAQGDLAGAQSRYAAGLAIAERLAAQDTGNAQWQRDLAVSRIQLAQVCKAGGDLAQALEHLHAARDLLQRLRLRAPDHPQLQNDLTWVESTIADWEQAAAPGGAAP